MITDPYRTNSPPGSVAPDDRLGFENAMIRVGAHRFELSCREDGVRVAAFAVAVFFIASCGLAFTPPLLTAPLMLGALLSMVLPRRHFIVTRQGSFGVTTVFGLRIASHELGRHPKIDNLGWDWEELAVYPTEAALRAGLHDDERFVLVEWADGEERKCRDGPHLLAIARAEVLRLHGEPQDPS